MLILLSGFGPACLVAAIEDYEGKPIGQITFEPRQQPLTPDELSALTGLRKNAPLRLSEVRDAIGRLVAT